MRLYQRIIAAAIAVASPVAMAAPTTLTFEGLGLNDGDPVGGAYSSLGLSFTGALMDTDTVAVFASPPAGVPDPTLNRVIGNNGDITIDTALDRAFQTTISFWLLGASNVQFNALDGMGGSVGSFSS